MADADILSAFLCKVFARTYGNALPAETLATHLAHDLSPAATVAMLASGASYAILAEADGGLLGSAVLTISPAPPGGLATIELAKLYVDPRKHGHGVAALLLDAALARARTLGYERIWLCVWECNPRALAFYRKHGFVAVGRAQVRVGEVVFEDFVMERSLS